MNHNITIYRYGRLGERSKVALSVRMRDGLVDHLIDDDVGSARFGNIGGQLSKEFFRIRGIRICGPVI